MIKLTEKDKKILNILDMDARLPISQIAKKVGLSKESTNYRIKRLEEKNVIEGYYMITNLSRLGYIYTKMFLKFQYLTPAKEKEIFEFCRSIPSVCWMISMEGTYNLVVAILAKNVIDVKEMTDRVYYKFSKYIQKRTISIATQIYHFKHSYLHGEKNSQELLFGKSYENFNFDQKDLMIINMLSKNAKSSIIDIAKQLKISPNGVKYRLKRLIDEEVILGFCADINYHILGYQHYKVFLFLQNMTKKINNSIIEYLRLNKNVIYITEVIGGADLEFEVILKSTEEFRKFMKKMKSHFSENIVRYDVDETFKEYFINFKLS